MLQAGLQKHVLGQDYFFNDEHFLNASQHHDNLQLCQPEHADKCLVWAQEHAL